MSKIKRKSFVDEKIDKLEINTDAKIALNLIKAKE
jgi:hypothetical protein